MKHARLALLLAPLPLALLAAFGPRADKLAFAPEAGATLTKTFELESELALESMNLEVDGQQIDPSMMGGDITGSVKITRSLTLLDEYVAIADGRPTKLRRNYEALEGLVSMEGSAGGESGSEQTEMESDLVGATVMWTWNPATSAYDRSFEGSAKPDAERLENLREDTDLRALLPAGEVEVGASWEVDAKVLGDLLWAGGSVESPSKEAASEEGPDLEELFGDVSPEELLAKIFAGKVKATYAGSSEVEGRKLGRVTLEAKVESDTDFAELIGRAIEAMAAESGEDIQVDMNTAAVAVRYDGEGELLWDLAGGHLHSCDLAGDFVVELTLSVGVDAMGESHSAELGLELSGSASASVTTKR